MGEMTYSRIDSQMSDVIKVSMLLTVRNVWSKTDRQESVRTYYVGLLYGGILHSSLPVIMIDNNMCTTSALKTAANPESVS